MECPCRRILLRSRRYNRNPLTLPIDYAAGFSLTVAARGCTKQVFKVQAVRPFLGTRRLPGVTPGALETHAFPTPALQNQQLALRGAGSFVLSSTSGQPRGKVADSDPSVV